MSKNKENYGWLNTKANSAKTLIERAIREVPDFANHIKKFEHQITIKSYAPSTVFSYGSHFKQYLTLEPERGPPVRVKPNLKRWEDTKS